MRWKHKVAWVVSGSALALAAGLLIITFHDPEPSGTPPARSPNSSNSATDTTVSRENTARHNDEKSDDGIVKNRTTSIALQFRLPPQWPKEESCELQFITPASESSDVIVDHSMDLELRSSINTAVKLEVPSGGLTFVVSGSSILPVLAGLRWSESDTSFRLLTRKELVEFGALNKRGRFNGSSSHLPPMVLRGSLDSGGALPVDIHPLVGVSTVIQDAQSRDFAPASIDWSFSWTIPATDHHDGCSNRPDSPRAGEPAYTWTVPAGSHLSVSPLVASADFGKFTPDHFNGQVPTNSGKLLLEFQLKAVELGFIRVASRIGEPLIQAQFRYDPAPNTTPLANVVGNEAGVFSIMLTDVARTIVVWAPGYMPSSILSSQIPTDGETVDVLLDAARSEVLIVRIDFEHTNSQRQPVQLRTVFGTSYGDRQHSWTCLLDLPDDGELVLTGQPSRTPVVEPVSSAYTFTLTETGEENGVPVRKFLASPVSGILLRLVNAEDVRWNAAEHARVVVSHSVRPFDGSEMLKYDVSDGAGIALKFGQIANLYVAPGMWQVQVWQDGETPLYGEATATVSRGLVEIAVSPVANPEWREIQIIDQTGHCSAKGTVFVFGRATIATMQEAAEQAQASSLGGRISLASTLAAVASHKEGWVWMPSYAPQIVAVIPQRTLSIYEGKVDWQSGTIVVVQGTWTGRVNFAPATGGTPELPQSLTESDWYVTIRECTDPRDLRRIDGADCKVPAEHGVAEIAALPEGTYVARYVRAKVEEHVEGATVSRKIVLEWFDAVKFTIGAGTNSISLPVTRG